MPFEAHLPWSDSQPARERVVRVPGEHRCGSRTERQQESQLTDRAETGEEAEPYSPSFSETDCHANANHDRHENPWGPSGDRKGYNQQSCDNNHEHQEPPLGETAVQEPAIGSAPPPCVQCFSFQLSEALAGRRREAAGNHLLFVFGDQRRRDHAQAPSLIGECPERADHGIGTFTVDDVEDTTPERRHVSAWHDDGRVLRVAQLEIDAEPSQTSPARRRSGWRYPGRIRDVEDCEATLR